MNFPKLFLISLNSALAAALRLLSFCCLLRSSLFSCSTCHPITPLHINPETTFRNTFCYLLLTTDTIYGLCLPVWMCMCVYINLGVLAHQFMPVWVLYIYTVYTRNTVNSHFLELLYPTFFQTTALSGLCPVYSLSKTAALGFFEISCNFVLWPFTYFNPSSFCKYLLHLFTCKIKPT